MVNESKKTILGITLTKLRKAHKLTQEQVADILKIKRSTYAYYERNITPTIENISKLAVLFSVSTHELMYGEPDPYYMIHGTLRSSSAIWENDDKKYDIPENTPNRFGQLTEEERYILCKYRLLNKNFKEKVFKELEELCDKSE